MNEDITNESRELTLSEKWAMLTLVHYHKDAPTKLTQEDIAKKFKTSVRTLQRIVDDYNDQIADGEKVPDMRSQKQGRCGAKSQLTPEKEDIIREINDGVKGNMPLEWLAEEYALKTGESIGVETLRRYFEGMGIVKGKTYLKPSLNDEQRLKRLKFIVSKLGNEKQFNLDPLRIHVDEKWFSVTRDGKMSWYDPNQPYHPEAVQHKSHIPKIMFLCAIGLPQEYKVKGKVRQFDGKIGCWPITEVVIAQRNSANRPAGTEITEAVTVNAERYYELMEEKVLPAIREKMAWAKNRQIIIQHDGARPHTGKGNTDDLRELGLGLGWKIGFDLQPPQSPDLNKCDLCFFHSLQRKAEKIKHARTVDGMIGAVETAYWAYPEDQLMRVHALTFEIFREILRSNGSNYYKIPHSNLRKRMNDGLIPWRLNCPKELLKQAREVIDSLENS